MKYVIKIRKGGGEDKDESETFSDHDDYRDFFDF